MKINKILFLIIPVLAFMLLACTDDTEDTTSEGMKMFNETGFGFNIEYPDNWIYEVDNWTVVFSGEKDTDEYFTTLNIQNLARGEEGYMNLEEIYEDFKTQLDTQNISEMKTSTFKQDGQEYPMIEMELEYTLNEENFKQIAYVIERDESIFHQISYTAPTDLYELSEDTVQKMFETFKILVE